MSDEIVEQPAQEPDDESAEIAAAAAQAIDDGKGNRMVPLSALLGTKKELRDATKRIKELEPQAEYGRTVGEKVDKAQPIIDAILADPQLAAAVARKTNPSQAQTEQPVNDPIATEYADTMGWYHPTTGEPDAARAQRAIKLHRSMARRESEDVVRPFAGMTLDGQANANMRTAIAQRDADGVPLATEESIREVAKMLPSHLLGNPQVVDLVLNTAIGLDRRNNRTPKAPDEPIYWETAGGRRAPEGAALTADEKAWCAKNGVDEKRYAATSKGLASGISNRTGIELGSKR